MAWVALYMTDKFIRRSPSQPAAASGAFKTREPSSEGMRFQDRRAVFRAALGQHVDPARQVARAGCCPRRTEQHGLAELDPVARVEGGLIDGLAVDERSVGRAQVEDAISPLIEPELGMAAGNFGIVEPNGVRVVPAQGHGTDM